MWRVFKDKCVARRARQKGFQKISFRRRRHLNAPNFEAD